MRIYDPKIDAWHIVLANLPGSYVTCQLGRRVGSEILQLGELEPNGELVRWIYRDITKNSFR